MRCGACHVICPQGKIEFDDNGKLSVDRQQCDDDCNMCTMICPGYDTNTPLFECI